MFFWNSFLIVWIFFPVRNVKAVEKISCFYNSSAQFRKPIVQVTFSELREAAPYCTHLVYGYLGIDERTYKVKLLNPLMDSKSGLENLQNTVELKFRNRSLKVLLSIGGSLDPKTHPYFKVLEANETRAIFIKSLVSMVVENGYDGADLAWQFPTHEENKTESVHDISVGFVKEHKTMFKYLIQELSAELTHHKRLLTLTVLPHVKADEFIDFDAVKDCVEHIHLMTYDYKTPFRNPNEADYAAPLYHVKNRNENRNVEQTVNWWIKQNVPAKKLLIAIPTFGRSWKTERSVVWKMKPPVKANGTPEANLGYPTDKGTVPYYELCTHLIDRKVKRRPHMLKRIRDEEHHFGTYAYRRGSAEYDGMWVSFEEPQTAAEKARFANRINLGGVAVVDLSLDDYSGRCKRNRDFEYCGDEFPILRAVKFSQADKPTS